MNRVYSAQEYVRARHEARHKSKVEEPKLSRADMRILKALQSNSDISNLELADRIGLSPSACLRRVSVLKEQGIIVRHVALLDRRKINLGVVAFVEIQVDRHNEAVDANFRAAIMKLPEVVSCHVMTGNFDYLLKVVTPNLDAYSDFALEGLLKIPGVKDVHSTFVLDMVKDETALPLGHLLETY